MGGLDVEFGVEIRNYKVIYEVLDDIRKAMVGLLGPTYKEEVIGRIEIRTGNAQFEVRAAS